MIGHERKVATRVHRLSLLTGSLVLAVLVALVAAAGAAQAKTTADAPVLNIGHRGLQATPPSTPSPPTTSPSRWGRGILASPRYFSIHSSMN